jgi:hypothetical protein
MAHPKAKREYTENVKERVEETRRKQKKLRSVSLWREEASDCHGEASPKTVLARRSSQKVRRSLGNYVI